MYCEILFMYNNFLIDFRAYELYMSTMKTNMNNIFSRYKCSRRFLKMTLKKIMLVYFKVNGLFRSTESLT